MFKGVYNYWSLKRIESLDKTWIIIIKNEIRYWIRIKSIIKFKSSLGIVIRQKRT